MGGCCSGRVGGLGGRSLRGTVGVAGILFTLLLLLLVVVVIVIRIVVIVHISFTYTHTGAGIAGRTFNGGEISGRSYIL